MFRDYHWRRIPGPKVTFYDGGFVVLHVEHSRPEPWSRWAKRIARHLVKGIGAPKP